MKKLLLITIVLLLQSFPSFSNSFGKGLICECKYKFIKQKRSICNYMNNLEDPTSKTSYGYKWHKAIYIEKNKLTVTSFYVDKDIIKEKSKTSDFSTNENFIYWKIEDEEYNLLRSDLRFNVSKTIDEQFVYHCKMYEGFREFKDKKLLLLEKLQTNYYANLKNKKI